MMKNVFPSMITAALLVGFCASPGYAQYLNRIYIEKEITFVEVQGTDIVTGWIKVQVRIQKIRIIDITLLDLQHIIQLFGCIFRITDPGNIPEVILVSLIDPYVNIERTIFIPRDGVAKDLSIPET